MKNLGGRPTKLTDELINKAYDYLEETSVMGVHALLPTIEGLALRLGVHRDTLQQWETTDDQFSVILKDVRHAQAQKLIQNALVGRYNPTITKLLLSKHGYVEQTDVTSGGEKIEPVVIYRPEKLED